MHIRFGEFLSLEQVSYYSGVTKCLNSWRGVLITESDGMDDHLGFRFLLTYNNPTPVKLKLGGG